MMSLSREKLRITVSAEPRLFAIFAGLQKDGAAYLLLCQSLV